MVAELGPHQLGTGELGSGMVQWAAAMAAVVGGDGEDVAQELQELGLLAVSGGGDNLDAERALVTALGSPSSPLVAAVVAGVRHPRPGSTRRPGGGGVVVAELAAGGRGGRRRSTSSSRVAVAAELAAG